MTNALSADAKVLVVCVARIGDTVLATPLLRALKQASPEGRLTMLAHPKRLEVLRHLPFIDRLGAIDKLRAPWRGRLPGREYHAAIVLGREPALVRYALRVSRRVAAYDEPGFPADGRLVRVPVQEGNHAVLDRFRLGSALGVEAGDPRLAYRVTAEEKSEARARLAARWPAPAGPLIGLQMTSFPTKSHRDWPLASFIALAQLLARDIPEARFVVLGDAAARRSAQPFLQAHAARSLLAAGDTGLRQAAALIGELDLYLGVDTGPTHIAGALARPMVALYHCRYPGRLLAPLGHPQCRVIEHPLTGQAQCADSGMDAIPVAEVHAAACQLLLPRAAVSA